PHCRLAQCRAACRHRGDRARGRRERGPPDRAVPRALEWRHPQLRAAPSIPVYRRRSQYGLAQRLRGGRPEGLHRHRRRLPAFRRCGTSWCVAARDQHARRVCDRRRARGLDQAGRRGSRRRCRRGSADSQRARIRARARLISREGTMPTNEQSDEKHSTSRDQGTWAIHFPDNLRWSNAMQIVKGMAPYGAIAMDEVDRIGRRLAARAGETDLDRVWREEWSAMADRVAGVADKAVAESREITAGHHYMRAGNYY